MNIKLIIASSIIFIYTIAIISCGDEPSETVVYDPKPYNFIYPERFDVPQLPSDNSLTDQGILLGKMLFHEKMMSKDNTQACASCHKQTEGFSDSNRFSKGVEGLTGNRQAMPIFNLAWHNNGFFWDGRSPSLRDQALKPIQDPLEMNEKLENVISKLKGTKLYKDQFYRAFGSNEITSEKIGLALEQFMMTIVSFNSKYDQFLDGKVQLTDSEERGRKLFFAEYNPNFPELSGADCAHCHGGPNFELGEYMNNGLDDNFIDLGRFKFTNLNEDKALFKMPSLRNVEYTAPYMHDGRFNTLEEVVEHYNSGVKNSETVSPLILPTIAKGLNLNQQQKTDLINFLKTLSDPSLKTNKDYAQ